MTNRQVRGLLNAVQRYAWKPANGGKTEVYVHLLYLLNSYSQIKLPYSVDRVESNDALYGGNQGYMEELSTYITKVHPPPPSPLPLPLPSSPPPSPLLPSSPSPLLPSSPLLPASPLPLSCLPFPHFSTPSTLLSKIMEEILGQLTELGNLDKGKQAMRVLDLVNTIVATMQVRRRPLTHSRVGVLAKPSRLTLPPHHHSPNCPSPSRS
jgi:hypothetical protein